MQIGTKVIVCAAGGVVLSTLGAVLTVYSISHANRVNELKGLMSAAIQQAETVMANVDQLHQRGAFNVERLSSSLKQNGSQDYRASVLYRTVPVVSGWEIRTNRCQGEGLRVLYAFPAGSAGAKSKESVARVRRRISLVRRWQRRVLP
jgi:hypothetical protein